MKQLEQQDLWCTTQPLNIPCNHPQIPGTCHHGHMQGRQPHAHGGKEPEEKKTINNTLTSKDAQSWIKPKSYSVKLECFHTRLVPEMHIFNFTSHNTESKLEGGGGEGTSTPKSSNRNLGGSPMTKVQAVSQGSLEWPFRSFVFSSEVAGGKARSANLRKEK